MAVKTDAEVIIGGKVFTLSGYESEEYLQKVASYVNNKINEYSKLDAFRRQPFERQSVLLQLNIADDYFKAKKQADSLEIDLELKDKQLYEIKHELIAAQIKLEADEKEQADLKKQISELQKDIIRLETRILEMKENQSKETKTTAKKSTASKNATISPLSETN